MRANSVDKLPFDNKTGSATGAGRPSIRIATKQAWTQYACGIQIDKRQILTWVVACSLVILNTSQQVNTPTARQLDVSLTKLRHLRNVACILDLGAELALYW